MEATQLVEWLWRGNPLVGFLCSKWQMLIEVECGLFSNFLGMGLLHPDIHHFSTYFIGRHQHGS